MPFMLGPSSLIHVLPDRVPMSSSVAVIDAANSTVATKRFNLEFDLNEVYQLISLVFTAPATPVKIRFTGTNTEGAFAVDKVSICPN